MKALIFILALTLGSVLNIKCQNTVLLYTSYPTQLNFIDAFNKSIPKQALWHKDDGGYILNIENLENTFVIANDENANFKLSNNSKLTKLISLQANNKQSIDKFFRSEKYCCVKLTDKQKKGTEKLFAVAVMKKSKTGYKNLEFAADNKTEITEIADFTLQWNSTLPVKHIYLTDINTLDIVWETKQYSNNNIKLSDFVSPKDFVYGHKYQLAIVIQNKDSEEKYSFEFDYNNLAFTTHEFYFPTTEALNIAWQTNEQIAEISLKDKTGKMLFANVTPKENSFSFESMSNEARAKFQSEQEYNLQITLENKQTYTYTFVVIMNLFESAELKALVE